MNQNNDQQLSGNNNDRTILLLNDFEVVNKPRKLDKNDVIHGSLKSLTHNKDRHENSAEFLLKNRKLFTLDVLVQQLIEDFSDRNVWGSNQDLNFLDEINNDNARGCSSLILLGNPDERNIVHRYRSHSSAFLKISEIVNCERVMRRRASEEVRKLSLSYDSKSRSRSSSFHREDRPFREKFFTIYRWFITTEDLLIHIVKRSSYLGMIRLYQSATYPCQRIKSCNDLRHTFHTFENDFQTELRLLEKLGNEELKFGDNPKILRLMLDIATEIYPFNNSLLKNLNDRIKNENWQRRTTIIDQEDERKSVEQAKKAEVTGETGYLKTLVLKDISSIQLARQMTFLDFQAFSRIHFNDLKDYTESGELKASSNLSDSAAFFNGLSQWVQCMVLNNSTPQKRGQMMVKFVEVARELKKLHNYNSFFAIVGGLTHSAIARLTRTQECLPQDTTKTIAKYSELISSNGNYLNYRKEFSNHSKSAIPIIGIYLKDLISIQNATSSFYDYTRAVETNCLRASIVEGILKQDVYVNFSKMASIANIIGKISELQQVTINIQENVPLCKMLRFSLDLNYSEDELYDLSLTKEPKSLVNQNSSNTLVFGDWVAGLVPPNEETVKKHVSDMVEAVFNLYDENHDGFISNTEFEAIVTNFPFIDSFSILDTNNDGMISRSEMISYFIKHNFHALRASFRHEFFETVCLKPTNCSHCGNIIWGLSKQSSMKCRRCSVHTHRACKDRIVQECKRTRKDTQKDAYIDQLPTNQRKYKSESVPNSTETVVNLRNPGNFKRAYIQRSPLFLDQQRKYSGNLTQLDITKYRNISIIFDQTS